jgi:hypothetical protein
MPCMLRPNPNIETASEQKKEQPQRVANDQMPKSDHFRVVVVVLYRTLRSVR